LLQPEVDGADAAYAQAGNVELAGGRHGRVVSGAAQLGEQRSGVGKSLDERAHE
jgi:hypothetical protein